MGIRALFSAPMPSATRIGTAPSPAGGEGNSATIFVKPEQVFDSYYDPESNYGAFASPAGEVYAGNSDQWQAEFAGAKPSRFYVASPVPVSDLPQSVVVTPTQWAGGQQRAHQPSFMPVGPVTQEASQTWSNLIDGVPVTFATGNDGPVGRSKYSDQVAQALAQANQETINDAIIAAGLVASV